MSSFEIWIEYLLRFSHLVAGIAWIGSSFYFIWLDSSFEPPAQPRRNVDGELFMVHGGFYYQVEKRKIYPGELPAVLHWFKWEATLTWLTGFLLFIFVYYLKGATLLIDQSVRPMSQAEAIGVSLAVLVWSWLVYDLIIWNVKLISNKTLSVLLSFFFFSGLIYGLFQIFSGRGAFIITGVIFGSMMLLNVWLRILPGQKKMIRQAELGQVPDYSVSLKSKIRSVHNTYFTFPVLFIMLSNHYPTIYTHKWNWLLLIMLTVSGALVRHVMVSKNSKERWVLLPAAFGLAGLVYMTAASVAVPTTRMAEPVSVSQVLAIVENRCMRCHSHHNTDEIWKVAPKNVFLDNEHHIRELGSTIYNQVVVSRAMPLGNQTGMTEEERQIVGRWLIQEKLIETP